MTPDEAKLWADRKRVVLSYIEEERTRGIALVLALGLDDKDFLLYCMAESWTAQEIDRARECFNMDKPVVEESIEDLM